MSDLEKMEEELSEARIKLAQSDRRIVELTETKNDAKEQLAKFKATTLEINKVSFEAMKHLTTLSAGSILLLVAFLEKLF